MTDGELIEKICGAAVQHGHFTLRSGRTSTYYIDKYLFETQPKILAELGHRLAAYADDKIDRLAGAELGGIPLVSAASIVSGIPSVLIRNQRKEYGTSKLLEGRLDPGDHVMLIEDVVTSGGQVIEAAKVIREAGGTVSKIIAVIDREEGGCEHIEAAGLMFHSLLTRTDLGLAES